MPVIPLVQGGQAWLDYRKSKIMATDTPIILGSNPWKTKLELWEEKLGFKEPPEMNDAMREGQRKEPIARALIEDTLGMKFTPIVYESDENPWMAASLDGISDCGKYIIEIKCPSKPVLHDKNDLPQIPIYYMDQMQHQMVCLKKPKINYFCTYFPENKDCPLKITKVEYHEGMDELIDEECYEFYVQMCNFDPPVEWKFKPKVK